MVFNTPKLTFLKPKFVYEIKNWIFMFRAPKLLFQAPKLVLSALWNWPLDIGSSLDFISTVSCDWSSHVLINFHLFCNNRRRGSKPIRLWARDRVSTMAFHQHFSRLRVWVGLGSGTGKSRPGTCSHWTRQIPAVVNIKKCI